MAPEVSGYETKPGATMAITSTMHAYHSIMLLLSSYIMVRIIIVAMKAQLLITSLHEVVPWTGSWTRMIIREIVRCHSGFVSAREFVPGELIR